METSWGRNPWQLLCWQLRFCFCEFTRDLFLQQWGCALSFSFTALHGVPWGCTDGCHIRAGVWGHLPLLLWVLPTLRASLSFQNQVSSLSIFPIASSLHSVVVACLVSGEDFSLLCLCILVVLVRGVHSICVESTVLCPCALCRGGGYVADGAVPAQPRQGI